MAFECIKEGRSDSPEVGSVITQKYSKGLGKVLGKHSSIGMEVKIFKFNIQIAAR